MQARSPHRFDLCAEFIDLIWDGFLDLEKEGWEVKCIECFETAEQAEQIYSMCEEGYDLIYSNGDDIKKAIEDLGSELNDAYPNVHFFFLDTYDHDASGRRDHGSF